MERWAQGVVISRIRSSGTAVSSAAVKVHRQPIASGIWAIAAYIRSVSGVMRVLRRNAIA